MSVSTAVPTIAQSVTIDWGSWLSQALVNETAIIEAAAEAGFNVALANVPLGSLVSSFVGPTIVKQYVDHGLAALEGVLAPDTLTIPASSVLETTVAKLINANEPDFAKFLGAELGPMIAAAVAKLKL